MPDNLIPGDAVRAIQDGVRVETIVIDGDSYTSRPVYQPPGPVFRPVAPIGLATLSGLIRFLKDLDDGEMVTSLLISSPTQVQALGDLDPSTGRRQLYADTTAILPSGFRFGTWYDPESFIIALQSAFAPTDESADLLRLIGNLKEETVKTAEDDGVSQRVGVRAGISLSTEAKVKSRLTLRPYCSFTEIEPPARDFILRLKRVENDLPHVALFDVCDGAWQLRAIQAVEEHLRNAMAAENIDSITVLA